MDLRVQKRRNCFFLFFGGEEWRWRREREKRVRKRRVGVKKRERKEPSIFCARSPPQARSFSRARPGGACSCFLADVSPRLDRKHISALCDRNRNQAVRDKASSDAQSEQRRWRKQPPPPLPLCFFFFFFARAKKEAGPGFHSATLRCDHFDSLRETKESMWPSSTGRKMPATKRSPVLVVAQRKRKSHHRDRHRSTKRRRRPTRPSSFPYSALFFAIFFAAVPLTTRYSKPCSLCGKHGQKESWRGGETKRAIGMDERRRAAAAAPSFDQRLFVVVVVVVAWQAAQGTITAPQSDAAAHAEQRRARAKPCGERRTWRPKKKKEEKVVRKLIFDFFFLPRRSALSPFSPP